MCIFTEMTGDELLKGLLKNFPYEPTKGQQNLLKKLSEFFTSEGKRSVFLLKGYAGTGKTAIVKTLVKTLPEINLKYVLLAPTGRAAKVLFGYVNQPVYTIHKKIYKRKDDGDSGYFMLQPNLHTNTIFIVDEASMIGNSSMDFKSSKSLLDDLIEYVYSGINCKIIFIGDAAQLPPVGQELSAALDEKILDKDYYLTVNFTELTEVMRQSESSGVLHNATNLRNLIRTNDTDIQLDTDNFKDVINVSGSDLEDALNSGYSKYGADQTIVICRSNKRANIYNQQIRARIRYLEDEIAAGDMLMVVKNNYFWLSPEATNVGFIANGDIVELLKVSNVKELFGFRFADARLRLVDYPNDPVLEVKIMLDTLTSETPALTNEQSKKLYSEVWESYSEIGDKRERFKKVKTDPYFNALQIKFAYAVTCHKAQGGQWPCVFVEQGYLTDEMLDVEFIRWLYTAVTRSSEKLYLINFNQKFLANQ